MSQLESCVVSHFVTSIEDSQSQPRENLRVSTSTTATVLIPSINSMTSESYDGTNIDINTELVGNTKPICVHGFRDARENTPIAFSELPQ